MFSRLAKLMPMGGRPVARVQPLRLFNTTMQNLEVFKIKNAKDFERKVMNSDKPVVVDFFANWCGPCKALTPRIEAIIDDMGGAIKLAKVDIDENEDLALDYEVGSVPVLLVMKDGKVVNRMVGLQESENIRNFIDKAVAEKAVVVNKK